VSLFKNYNKAIALALQPLKMRRRKQFNPTHPLKEGGASVPNASFEVFQYAVSSCQHFKTKSISECIINPEAGKVTWINMDGLPKASVEMLGEHFHIHPLLIEDILSSGQRAKADNMETQLFCLLPMIRYNMDTGSVNTEQLSLVLGENYVLSFQEEPNYDPFNMLRDRIKKGDNHLHQKTADYLLYALIDAVVDQYFNVLDNLRMRLDKLEDEVVITYSKGALLKISLLRREIMLMQRAIGPVRELVSYFLTTDNTLIKKSNRKYFKDIYDHIMLAIEYTDNYREMIVNLQELNMNQVNTRMNEVMKTLTVVTTLLAPATVIGSIFGMNFAKIPFTNSSSGFLVTVFVMLLIGFLMILYFKWKKWF